MSTLNKVVKYLLSNTISSGINFFSRWFLNYALASLMQLSAFGIYSFIFALANVFKGIISFGAQIFLIYKIAQDGETKYANFFRSCYLSFVIMVFLLLMLGVVHFFHFEAIDSGYFLYAILLAAIMAFVQNIYSFFKGLGLFGKETEGYLVYLMAILAFTGVIYIDQLNSELFTVLTVVMGMQLVLFLYSGYQFYHFYKAEVEVENLNGVRAGIRALFLSRSSYGLHELQSVLYVNATILVLGFMVEEQDLAIYKSLQIIIVPFSILPMIFSQVLLKQLSEHLANNKSIRKLFRTFNITTAIIGAFLFVVFYYFGEDVIHLFYGDKLSSYASVKEIILLLTVAYFFRFLSANYGSLITANDRQRVRVYATGMLIIITIVATIILTNYMGIVGAAYANAIAYFSIMFVYATYSEIKLI
jgi:O-antigen/teichoic acid export membrane protein